MSGYVRFKMWESHRQLLIENHRFYVKQACKRLLSQFDGIELEAKKAAEEWLERRSHHFNQDRHDPSSDYEAANDVGNEFYGLLGNMRDQTRLSVVAGMFHEWEKQLRDWLVIEIGHWHRGDQTTSAVWSADFGRIAELLECLGWKVRNAPYFATLDACRLIVNVYKHGEGKSFRDLKQHYPEYLENPYQLIANVIPDGGYRDHQHLKVSDEQFQSISEAIVAFWCEVPANVLDSHVTKLPNWLTKAMSNDTT